MEKKAKEEAEDKDGEGNGGDQKGTEMEEEDPNTQ